jgi:hypothetical protein
MPSRPAELIQVSGYAEPVSAWLVDHLRRRPADRPPRPSESPRARDDWMPWDGRPPPCPRRHGWLAVRLRRRP